MSEKQTLVQRAQRALRGEEPWEPIMERINSFVRGDLDAQLSALRAELERKDAALKAAERVCITQIEREDAIAAFEAVDGCMNDEMVRLGRANIAAREALASYRAALQPCERLAARILGARKP